MEEYRYDNAGSNARRLGLFVLALGILGAEGLLLLGDWHFEPGYWMLAGPVLMALYLYDLFRHYRHRDDRIVLEGDTITIWRAGTPRTLERSQVQQAYHTGALLHITLTGEQPIQLPATFQRQDELCKKLSK